MFHILKNLMAVATPVIIKTPFNPRNRSVNAMYLNSGRSNHFLSGINDARNKNNWIQKHLTTERAQQKEKS
jgi:N-acetylglutamate synthase/N-acetylornithine aminotransferase